MPDFRRPRILTEVLFSCAFVACLTFGAASDAYAVSGGSFGGGSFGGGGSSYTGGGARGSTSDEKPYQVTLVETGDPERPYEAVSNSEERQTDGGGSLGPVIIFASFFGLIALGAWFGKGAKKGAGDSYSIAVYRFGVDGALTQLRTHLEELALSTDMTSFDGRSAALSSIGLELQRKSESVFFADIQTWEDVKGSAAEQQFQQRAMESRAKFDRETIRADAAGVRQQEKNVALDGELLDEDGDFLVNEILVLTLVLATRPQIAHPSTLANHEQLRAALAAVGSMPADALIALEVIWSPSADSDTMTVEEMQRSYPRLMRL